jgi:hypothetical protein
VPALQDALTQLLPQIKSKDAKAWFRLAQGNSTTSTNPI